MPTVEEIVAEVLEAKSAKFAGLVSVGQLASILSRDKRNISRAAKKMGVEYAHTDLHGAAYFTKADAAKVAERLA